MSTIKRNITILTIFIVLISILGNNNILAISQEEQFINSIAPQAQELCYDRDLFASVMIAQAAIESNFGKSGLSSPPYYNYFGIKGSYKGQYGMFSTREDDGTGNLYEIKAAFRKYPNARASLEDYANHLLSYGNNFYNGVKRSVCKHNYKNATRFLTGRYATDTTYYNKLNGLISYYNLTRFDRRKPEKIKQMKVVEIMPNEIDNDIIQPCEKFVEEYNIKEIEKEINDEFSSNEIKTQILDIDILNTRLNWNLVEEGNIK